MQTKYRLIIVGAGIAGSSAAYHLAQLGWRDILVIDKGELFEIDGSTSHAPGGMFLTNSSKMMVEFARHSRQWYGELHTTAVAEGSEPLMYGVGGLEVAYNKERMQDLQRRWGWAKSPERTWPALRYPPMVRWSWLIDPRSRVPKFLHQQ